MSDKKKITYRRATIKDLDKIQEFVDFWLSGRAKAKGITTGGDDYFIPRSQHESYLKTCYVVLAFDVESKIIGWAVKERKNIMIHLLVAGDYRGQGVGKQMLDTLKPDIIRSKSDQQTGDPYSFYAKNGYVKAIDKKFGKHKNIELLSKKGKTAVLEEKIINPGAT